MIYGVRRGRKSMITLTGKKVSEGIAVGKLSFYKRDAREVRRIYVKDVEKEIQRFLKARQKAVTELKMLYDTAAKEVGDANAAIFEMQQMILEDQEFVDSVNSIIVEEKLNAEYAIQMVAEKYITGEISKEINLAQGHEIDVKDVASRVLRILSRRQPENYIPARQFSWTRAKYWDLSPGTEQLILIRLCWPARREFLP